MRINARVGVSGSASRSYGYGGLTVLYSYGHLTVSAWFYRGRRSRAVLAFAVSLRAGHPARRLDHLSDALSSAGARSIQHLCRHPTALRMYIQFTVLYCTNDGPFIYCTVNIKYTVHVPVYTRTYKIIKYVSINIISLQYCISYTVLYIQYLLTRILVT